MILFFMIFGISSCAAKKITSAKNTVVANRYTKNSNTEFISASEKRRYEDSVARKAVVFDLDNPYNGNVTNYNSNSSSSSVQVLNNDPNRIHNIAVILPFNLDQIPLGQYVDDSTKQLNVDSKNAVEFYLGCQMAREKFQSQNLKTNVYFLDDKNDSLTTSKLFTQKPFPNVDYIVGPVSFKNLKQASGLAKSNQIPLISPFVNSSYIKENIYYYNANPSLISQYVFLLQQTKIKFPSKVLEVIYDGKDSTADNINLLKDIADQYYGNSGIKYFSLSSADDIVKAMIQTDTLSQRLVLIYSSKDVYVKSVIGKIKLIKNDLQIFTSSCVKNTKALADVKYPHGIYTVYPYNTGNINYTLFDGKFEAKYMKKPTEIAFQAFDIMMHLFNLLDKNQTLQDNSYNYSADFDNTQSKFQFKAVLNENGKIDYFDNNVMYLYKYNVGNFSILNSH